MSNLNPLQLTNDAKAEAIVNASFFWFDRMIVPFAEKTKGHDHSQTLFDVYGQILKHFITQVERRMLTRDWYNTYVLGCVDYLPCQSWMIDIERLFIEGPKFPQGKYALCFNEDWTLYLLNEGGTQTPLTRCIPDPVPFFECAYDVQQYYYPIATNKKVYENRR